jgi:hypothetical protein
VFVGVGQSVDFINHEFGVGGGVRVLRKGLVDGWRSVVRNSDSVCSIWIEGDEWRRNIVLDEAAVKNTVSHATADLAQNLGPSR